MCVNLKIKRLYKPFEIDAITLERYRANPFKDGDGCIRVKTFNEVRKEVVAELDAADE